MADVENGVQNIGVWRGKNWACHHAGTVVASPAMDSSKNLSSPKGKPAAGYSREAEGGQSQTLRNAGENAWHHKNAPQDTASQ
jgi:hypothetical protein